MQRPSLPRGIRVQVGGVPLVVSWGACILIGLLLLLVAGVLGQWLIVAGVFVCALSMLAHEAGHALSARRQRLEVLGIALKPIGAAAYLWGPVESGRVQRKLASSGPLVSALLGGAGTAGAWLARSQRLPLTLCLIVAATNLLIVAVNLLPVRPSDGSKILAGLLWQRLGSKQAAAVALDRIEAALFALLALAALMLLASGYLGRGAELGFIGAVLLLQRQLALREQRRVSRPG